MGLNPKVLLIYTGGTIGMMKNEEGVYIPFDFSLIESQFPEINQMGCELIVQSFDPPLDSSNASPAFWIKIARIIHENYQECDGFVILHGSDTMAYTGSALSFMLEEIGKPVILTGAQLPINEIRTDAKENLITAIQIAAHRDTPIREVCIFFEHRLFRANRTKKVNSEVFSAFDSPNFPPLAMAGVHLKFYHPTPADAYSGKPFRIQEQLETRIALQKFFPGISSDILEPTFLNEQVRGIIIESYGTGNLPTDKDLMDTIRESVARGKIILNITQCQAGSVEMGRYETSQFLLELGVLSGKDLTFEAAITKMMYIMGKYQQPDEIKHYLTRNIRGEMKAERAYT